MWYLKLAGCVFGVSVVYSGEGGNNVDIPNF